MASEIIFSKSEKYPRSSCALSLSLMEPDQLSVEQLNNIRQNLEKELEHLTESFGQLRQAQAKFQDCAQSVKQTSQQGETGKEILVPLTSSLYVPGVMVEPHKFIVDVGTDYFVEKTANDAVKFFDTKVETLNKNLVDLDKIVNEKMQTLQQVESLFTQKLRSSMQQKKPEEAK